MSSRHTARTCGRAILAAALLGTASFALAAPPAIVFEGEVCDLGSIVQGEQPACVFSFANSGGDTLRILQVEPTCGCTTALPRQSVLQAGERGSIEVVFDSENFAGDVVKEIGVRSNDPARPGLTLRVKALVEPEVEFEPPALSFEAVGGGAAVSEAVALTNRRAEAVRVLRLTVEPSSYRCLIPAWTDTSRPLVLESWDRVTIEVHFTPPPTLAMAVAGECALEIEGARKRHFRLKLLALPGPR